MGSKVGQAELKSISDAPPSRLDTFFPFDMFPVGTLSV
jgi:hypothetical protein